MGAGIVAAAARAATLTAAEFMARGFRSPVGDVDAVLDMQGKLALPTSVTLPWRLAGGGSTTRGRSIMGATGSTNMSRDIECKNRLSIGGDVFIAIACNRCIGPDNLPSRGDLEQERLAWICEFPSPPVRIGDALIKGFLPLLLIIQCLASPSRLNLKYELWGLHMCKSKTHVRLV